MHYAWIRYRTRHASGPSSWSHREVAFEDAPSEKSDEFKSLLNELDYELSTHSEYWRGIDAEIVTPSRATLTNHILTLRRNLKDTFAALERAEQILENTPPDPDPDGIWSTRWYAAGHAARDAALESNPNDHISAVTDAVDAAIKAYNAENP